MRTRKPKGYWNYQHCYEEAKKYSLKSEFYKQSGTAYKVALRNGWLNDYSWLLEIQKPSGYWNYKNCYDEAKKYNSRWEFAKKSQTAYNCARSKKWLDNYTWLDSKATLRGFWNYERSYEEAKKYRSKSEFNKKASYVYKLALKKGWLKDYTWFEEKFKWTYEACLKVAKHFKTKSDFKQNQPKAYNAAIRHGWISHFDWMLKTRVNVLLELVDCVYLYHFEEYNAVYIGRTINKSRRDREHIFNKDDDTVAKFASKHKCPVPKMIILEDNLSIVQGQEREDYWINQYRQQGYHILNKAKTGLGIGSLGKLECTKWSKKTCYEEAKKYSSRKEFQIGNVSAYTRALQRGWLKEYTWFKRPRTWNKVWDKESCYQEALKYKTISSFRKNNLGAYNAALKNKWTKDYFWFKITSKPAGYWTYERCYEEAKKYHSRSEFKKNSVSAYKTALAKGWLDDYTWFVRLWEFKWNKETCYLEAQKYKTRKEFHTGSASAYAAAHRNGWLDEFFPQKTNET